MVFRIFLCPLIDATQRCHWSVDIFTGYGFRSAAIFQLAVERAMAAPESRGLPGYPPCWKPNGRVRAGYRASSAAVLFPFANWAGIRRVAATVRMQESRFLQTLKMQPLKNISCASPSLRCNEV